MNDIKREKVSILRDKLNTLVGLIDQYSNEIEEIEQEIKSRGLKPWK